MHLSPAECGFQIRVLTRTARKAHHPFFPSNIWKSPPAKSPTATALGQEIISNLKYAIPPTIAPAPQHTMPLTILNLRPRSSMLHFTRRL